jgi:hypothetical protein
MTPVELAFVAALICCALVVAWLFPKGPTLSSVGPVIETLWVYGNDKSWHRLVHKKTGKEILIKLSVLDGIKQLHLQFAHHDTSEVETLQSWLAKRFPELGRPVVKVTADKIVLGGSALGITEFVQAFGIEHLGWGMADRLNLIIDNPQRFAKMISQKKLQER